MIHDYCRSIYNELVDEMLKRGEMDEATFMVMRKTKRNFHLVRKAIDPAMSSQNVFIQQKLKEFLECECPLVQEEELMRRKQLAPVR